MDKLTKRRLGAFYHELHWLRPILRPYECWIDDVQRENFAPRHLEWKLGTVNRGNTRSHASALLVDASSSSVRIAELTPHVRLSLLQWVLKTLRLIDPVEYWTLYGALRRLRDGETKNPDLVALERGKWIVVLHESEVLNLLGVVTKSEVSVTLLRVRTNDQLSEHMALYDQSRWAKTQMAEPNKMRNVL